jgi:murein DD-endopeptidase MepM/ murein hydrolase activator NlpD
LILAGVILGLLAFAGWGRLKRRAPWPDLLAPVIKRAGVIDATSPEDSGFPQDESDPPGAQVALVRSAVLTATGDLPSASTPFSTTAGGDVIDEVDELEIPWAEREMRERIITYTVQTGDNLWFIADRFDLDVDTLRWSNPDLERNPDLLPVGMDLTILPVPGIYHTVQAGETLSDIAARYGVAEIDILNYPPNELAGAKKLLAGQGLIVPHGGKELARPTPQPVLDSPFAWPLVGILTQLFHDEHRAIDIGAPYGSPVYAGRQGWVTGSGWARTGYGYTVIIDHGEGLKSLYSHMKGEWVAVGDWVERGQLIGEVGSTGNSSGPHLHFEVRVDGERMDPLEYLPDEGPR